MLFPFKDSAWCAALCIYINKPPLTTNLAFYALMMMSNKEKIVTLHQ